MWGIYDMGISRDSELRRRTVQEMGSSREKDFTRWGVHDIGIVADSKLQVSNPFKDFCVAKAPDAIDAVKHRLSFGKQKRQNV